MALPTNQIVQGDCLEVMRGWPDGSVDAIVCDPPYELGFMGKAWDSTGVAYRVEVWAEALRVLKPGGHLLAFGGTRTYHRMACAIEDAGFEIRDQMQWLYGSGFPKSLNLKDEWDGWGTALKPANEPICVARKPFKGTVAANVLEHGTGALNIDGCRVEISDEPQYPVPGAGRVGANGTYNGGWAGKAASPSQPHATSVRHHAKGRWPANVILDEEAGAILDAQSGESKVGGSLNSVGTRTSAGGMFGLVGGLESWYDRSGGASRFFYCAKASRRERNAGCDGIDEQRAPQEYRLRDKGCQGGTHNNTPRRNHHPTVKPVKLMAYLVRLVTPPGGIVLDPFAGSGTTCMAAKTEGFDHIGIELSPEYCEIARRRVAHIERSLF